MTVGIGVIVTKISTEKCRGFKVFSKHHTECYINYIIPQKCRTVLFLKK